MKDTPTISVLVTGGAGYIGSHAVLALQDAGYRPVVIDNLSTGFRFAVPESVPLYEGDIADEALLARIFSEEGIAAINARHRDCLCRADGALESATALLESAAAPELAALELRGALEALGEISGKVDAEEILGAIFSRFCIGK